MAAEKQWTTLELMTWTQGFLKTKGIANPRLEAELLLAHAMGCKRIELYVQFEKIVAAGVLASYRELIKRRAEHEPVAYLTGTAGFHRHVFAVDRNVLIPRPETEVLVEDAIAWLKARGDGVTIADLGCGSGCIGLSLAAALPTARALLTDASESALAVARRNAETLQVSDRTEFLAGDWLAPLAGREPLDCLLSNPPYIGEGEACELPRDVIDYEPRAALFSGPDGLTAIRHLLAGAGEFVKPGGRMYLEVGYRQRPAVDALLAAPWSDARWLRDLAGIDRVLCVTRA